MSTQSTPTDLVDLPPSAKLVAKVLQYEEPLTQQGLVEHTWLPARTVRYALVRLTDSGLVASTPYVGDARQDQYRLTVEFDIPAGIEN